MPMGIAKELEEISLHLASLAQELRVAFNEAFSGETADDSLNMLRQHMGKLLHMHLDELQCADLFAQIISYGLFAAHLQMPRNTPLGREQVISLFSDAVFPFRAMFAAITQSKLHEQIESAIEKIIQLLNCGGRDEIAQALEKYTRLADVLMYWYELFLAAYDPQQRSTRGVYYTPTPVVSYIVGSVDALLKRDFAIEHGLADRATSTISVEDKDGQHSVDIARIQLLDPAVGTGAFVHGLIDYMDASCGNDAQQWPDAAPHTCLPQLTGFELLPIPYFVAQINLLMHVARPGCALSNRMKLDLHRANTLEAYVDAARLPLAHMLTGVRSASDRGNTAAPIMVILGNPPYAGHSSNNGAWISELLHNAEGNYFTIDGERLAERNSKWLNDDYVKFIRLAQEYVARVGSGIVAFVTNHGYLDNPTFRGMRRSLMQTFDELYLLDLHGNSKKKERAPDGSKDENVFDIQQGVAIGIFVKRGLPYHTAAVYHADVWGPRESYQEEGRNSKRGKFTWLAEHDVTTTAWTRFEPVAPIYLLVPRDDRLRAEYERGWRIDQIMETYSLGVLTKRDALVVGFDQAEVYRNMQKFTDETLSDSEIAAHFRLPWRDKDRWDLLRARAAMSYGLDGGAITGIAYRPFDVRAVYYDERLIARMNTRLMQHMRRANRALVIGRQGAATGAASWDVAFVTNMLVDQNIFRRGGGTVFPLYLYRDGDEQETAPPNNQRATSSIRHPNLAPAFIEALVRQLDMSYISDGKGDLRETFGPEDVFNYMYAVFFSPNYRTRYAPLLKHDFPRLPLPSHAAQFRALCLLGDRLAGLHLLVQSEQYPDGFPRHSAPGRDKSAPTPSPSNLRHSAFTGAEDNMIEHVEYEEQVNEGQVCQGRIYINQKQYFADVPQEVWAFHIGGYAVCHKWLHDRKGRMLSQEEIRRYQQLVAAVTETLAIMKEIDSIVAYTPC